MKILCLVMTALALVLASPAFADDVHPITMQAATVSAVRALMTVRRASVLSIQGVFVTLPSFVLIAVLACGVLMAAEFAAAAEESPMPDGVIPSALGMQLKPPTSTPADLKAVHDLGARYFRRGFYWNGIEKEKGKYDFAEYDAMLDEADKLGLGVVAVLFGSNKHYEQTDGGIQTEAGRQGFADFAAALAERYKGRKILWEIWNEPNTRTFWSKSGKGNTDEFATQYVDLVKAVAPAMLKADPDCFILGGSLSNYWIRSYEWTEFCFQKGILETGIRAWSVHPYGMKTPEEHATGHAKMRELMDKYGRRLPILNTERGFAVKRPQAELEMEGWSGGSEEKALEHESWHFVRQVMIDQMCDVPLTLWYEWKGDRFGLIDADGKPRPAINAVKVLVAQFSGYRFHERLKTESDLDYLLVFRNPQGHQKLVAWTAPPAGQTPDSFTAHAVEVPIAGASGSLTAMDVHGKESRLDVTEGKITLRLTGAPQYVVLPDATR